jgi:hypothetical protein
MGLIAVVGENRAGKNYYSHYKPCPLKSVSSGKSWDMFALLHLSMKKSKTDFFDANISQLFPLDKLFSGQGL